MLTDASDRRRRVNRLVQPRLPTDLPEVAHSNSGRDVFRCFRTQRLRLRSLELI